MYLEKINGPEDVKKIKIDELPVLAHEIRDALLVRASKHGGHFGPNFGMVEATIALHYVFESPKDKIVYDVSHQSYPHKMLTGRKEAYLSEQHYDDVSGYTNPNESEHDFFTVGHTSTSVSLAAGLAKARDLKGENGNVIAVIGDGSLSGGEALEGLDLLDDIRDDILPNLRVVFYTVYDKYILDALRASAFDYLLKPYLIDELAALIERFHTTEPADVACMERSLRKILNRDSRFAIQTVSGLLLVRCEEIFLFQFLGDQRCWQIVLTSRTTHKLKMSTTAKDLLSINNAFVQISQDCIVNLTYLMFIENKTLRCEFYPPFQEEERIASHRYFKQLRERLDII